MNIKDLIKSTGRLVGYGKTETFSRKQFGSIYAFNKTVRVKPNSSIIEVSMMIQAVTEKVFQKTTGRRIAAAHKVMVSIAGTDQEAISATDLVKRVRLSDKAYADEKAFPSDMILELVEKGDIKFFEDKTIFKNSASGYVIVSDNIPETSEIRVWCSCSSYYWVFQYYNVENNVDIWGKKPQKYMPKTKRGWEAQKKNRPLRNPGRFPGMCKHIMLLLALLMDKGSLAGSGGVVNSYRANIKRFKQTDRLSPEAYSRIMKNYNNDHRRILQSRTFYSTSPGFTSIASMQRANKNSWASQNKWKGGGWSK